MTGIQEHQDLDEFFDRIGRNTSCTEGSIIVCRRMIFGESCDTLVTIDPTTPHLECEACGRMAVLCVGCSFSREDDSCVAYEPECRFNYGRQGTG